MARIIQAKPVLPALPLVVLVNQSGLRVPVTSEEISENLNLDNLVRSVLVHSEIILKMQIAFLIPETSTSSSVVFPDMKSYMPELVGTCPPAAFQFIIENVGKKSYQIA